MNNEQDRYLAGSSRLVSEGNSRRCEGLRRANGGQGSGLRRGGHTEALVIAAYSTIISPARLNLMLGKDKP